MNELKIFHYQDKQIRTVEKDGEPWWVLKDVCEVLEISNPTVTASRLDSDEVTKFDLGGLSGVTNIINESGLYNVILRSDKPQAKPFRKWVTNEVLPSIRKTGGYMAGQEQLSPSELMAKALMVAQKTLAERDARISALTVENEVMRPKAGYFDDMVDRKLNTGIRETAKELSVKERAFVAFLLKGKYLYRDQKKKLQPYAQYVDDLFVLKECFNEKTNWSGTQLLITPKGRETFRLLCQGI